MSYLVGAEIDFDASTGRIVQLCAVPPGLVSGDGPEPRTTVVALALIEFHLQTDSGRYDGYEVLPVVAGYGDETDDLRVQYPAELSELYYLVSAFGDAARPVSIGPGALA